MRETIFRPARVSPRWRPDIGVYLLAHFAKSQLWHASTLLFGFFLTETCGLTPMAMGLVLAGSLILNGVADAMLGRHSRSLAAGLRSQPARAVITCAFFLAFCATPLLAAESRLPWALVTILGFRLSYAFVDVPQNAAVALIVDGADARCSLLAGRNIVSALANLAVGVIAAPLLIHGHGIGPWLAWAGGVALLVCGTAPALRRLAPTREAPPHASAAPDDDRAGPSPPIRLLLGTLMLMMLACSAFRSLEPYYAAFVGKSVGMMASAALGGMISQPLWAMCRRRIGVAASLTVIALLLVVAALLLLGPWRAERSVAAMVGLAFGAGTSGLWLLLWTALMAHAGADAAPTRVGAFTCVSKLAQGAAMLVTGQVLATSAYRTALADAGSDLLLPMAAALAAIAVAALALRAGSVEQRMVKDQRGRPQRHGQFGFETRDRRDRRGRPAVTADRPVIFGPVDAVDDPLRQRPGEPPAQDDRLAIQCEAQRAEQEGEGRQVSRQPGLDAGPVGIEACDHVGDART